MIHIAGLFGKYNMSAALKSVSELWLANAITAARYHDYRRNQEAHATLIRYSYFMDAANSFYIATPSMVLYRRNSVADPHRDIVEFHDLQTLSPRESYVCVT